MNFKHFGVMLDCSRNAVMKVESVKKYIDILERLGYNTLMLYTEDTFEVNNQPFFGYLRGRYSKSELKEIDKYAAEHNIELIPCIQTLAHLNGIVRWRAYNDYRDVHDILLAGDERTYKLIEDIFATLSECLTSRVVNIGMDEAHMVGLGKYLDINGYQNRFEILLNHLKRVCEIAEKYGFKSIMWSDMFFRLAGDGHYYAENIKIDEKITSLVPKELGLIYWDYYAKDRSRYDNMIVAHKQFDNEIWFAGGLWCWNGFAPRNLFSIDTIKAAMPSLVDNGIENVIFTLWGDDGKECSNYAVLPSLYYASMYAKGITDEGEIKAGFLKEFGIPFDDFMLLDLPDTCGLEKNSNLNPEKYMFYNDPFNGILDCTIDDGFEPRYDECEKKLKKHKNNKDYGYLFDFYAKLCSFLQLKYTIGKRTREAYRCDDKKELKRLVSEYQDMFSRLDEFYKAYKKVWFENNKPFGFDVQDIRIGGLKQRICYCGERLDDYIKGKILKIEELEEDILNEFPEKYCYFNNWATNATVNVITHERYN